MKNGIKGTMIIIAVSLLMACTNMQVEIQEEAGTTIEYPNQLIVNKDVLLIDGEEQSDYEPLVITNPAQIRELFDEIHGLDYRESNQIIDFSGYMYTIEWDDENKIEYANNDYFYYNDPNRLYQITDGNLEFLNELDFSQK